MMLDTADNKIFFARFYDIDTICSYDNSGQLKFDVDIEMEQGYWNTSSSRLWTRIRDLMHDDIVTTYNNMRQNGVSYENMMKYIYDEQIAKIPQTYYNKDYDVKYAPFADSYIGMAHGDTYEHVKRWLKQRFTFVDTLFDYAPSYNNDVLTIRANTTELMTLEIETYTPVYQHLSWYNGQMDKKKIDGKVSVEFSGTAQAATDQEVLIYGGSNVKSIKGITSMNPNRMLIGSATKLVEIDAHDCPLLADINANKANLSPHEYLNKVNLSNCPLLEGNLRLNNSPLVQEINIKGTNITGMNLPSSIRNLQILRLPNTMTELSLNDAGMLHTLEFDEGVNLQSISMTNCNALENVINFDLLQTPSITLNNSYNNVAELYFRDTTNLSLSNMSNLERVIYTPNNEHETFELINVANAPNYKVTTFNCPKLSTFMTTAPYRESYNDCGTTEIVYIGKGYQTVLEEYNPNGEKFKHTLSTHMFDKDNGVEIEIDVSSCIGGKDENIVSIGVTSIDYYKTSGTYHFYYNSQNRLLQMYNASTQINTTITLENNENIIHIKFNKSGLFINDIRYASYSYDNSVNAILVGSEEGVNRSNATINHLRYYTKVPNMTIQAKDYGDVKPNEVFEANLIDISNTQFTDVKLLCTTDTNTLKLPTTVKNFYCDSSFDLDTDYLEDGEYDVVHGELVEQYTTDYKGEIFSEKLTTNTYQFVTKGTYYQGSGYEVKTSNAATTDFISVYEQQEITLISVDKKTYTHNVYVSYWDENKNIVIPTNKYYGENITAQGEILSFENTKIVIPNNVKYVRFGSSYGRYYSDLIFGTIIREAPNLIPSSADGSLIFSMYAPSNAVAPASGTWDLKGLQFDNFHTFGMNNDVKSDTTYYYNYYENEHLPFMTKSDFLNTFLGKTINSNKSLQLYEYYKENDKYIYIVNRNLQLPSTIVDDFAENTTFIKFKFVNADALESSIIYVDGVPYYRGNLVSMEGKWYDSTINSVAMPARYDDYNITIKNAYIAPREYNTMLYPLLVNEDNPIQSSVLDYSNYRGEYLSWSFAYVKLGSLTIYQPKDEFINSYEFRYNAFYQTDYEFDNPYEIARYTSSASGVLPTFNSEFTYTYDEIDNGDGTYTTKIYADSLDNLPTTFSFAGNTDLLSVEKLDTSNAVILSYLFSTCANLTSVNTTDWDTNKVTHMTNMFYGCSKLTSLDVSGFDTSNVTNMSGMFQYCGIESIDLTDWDVSKVTNMSNLFCGAKVKTVDFTGWDTSSVTDMRNIFYECGTIETIIGMEGFNTSNATNISGIFYYTMKIKHNIDFSRWVTTKNTSLYRMFQYSAFTDLSSISDWDTSNVTDMTNTFFSYKGISLDLSKWDTSKVTNMNSMFYGCSSLTSLDVSNFNTSNVTRMDGVFHSCSSLISLDLSNFNTSNVINMVNMFYNCSSLTSLDVSNFDTSNVTSMASMFNGCSSLTSLDLSNFDTSKVTEMHGMFQYCSQLTSLDSMQNISTSLVLSSTKLDAASLLDVINNLSTVTTTQTLTLGSTLSAKLTEDQIAIATNKGWTVA